MEKENPSSGGTSTTIYFLLCDPKDRQSVLPDVRMQSASIQVTTVQSLHTHLYLHSNHTPLILYYFPPSTTFPPPHSMLPLMLLNVGLLFLNAMPSFEERF